MNNDKEWQFLADKLLKERDRYLYTNIDKLDFTGFVTGERLSCDQARKGSFRPIQPGECWGDTWLYAWFSTVITVPPEAAGKRVVVKADLGAEATIYIDGHVRGAFDLQHHDITITRNAASGDTFEFLAESYAGHDGKRPRFGEGYLCVFEEEVYQFFIDFECLYQVRNHMDRQSLRVSEIDKCLTRVLMLVDWQLQGRELHDNLQACRALMQPLLASVNGPTSPLLYLMGQSHLDIAWLWPMEETKRKIARTLSNQLALMEEYPTYTYVQSQPYLLQLVKELYPELYARVRQAIADGRIVPEGGMWVEADTNLTGGESLIRQILYGKRFFQEEYGADSEMLWLPDVFGYSGSLPQIMKGCGLRYFASVKMFQTYENIVDPFPYNTFMWEGIDGTQILTHLLDYGDYPIKVTPSFLIRQWNDRIQQDGISTRLVQFGHGDGGGGANRDDMEFLKRLENLEGVPRTTHGSPIRFFEDQLKEGGAPEARYVGELYYPAHRGTYTTQAPIKRLNRKAEVGLREVEFWGAAASVLRNAKYPREELERLWKTVLLHQFHDILPGTSIHRVHAEAQAVLTAANEAISELAAAQRQHLAGGPEGDARVTVFNSLSWERTEIVALPEACKAASLASGEHLPIQRHEGITYAEITVPPAGWITCLTNGEPQPVADQPAVRAAADRLENEYVVIRLNDEGEIVSMVDKETGNEWAAGVCNAMRLYRDNPSAFDAWEIDRRYRAARKDIAAATRISVKASGPLLAAIHVEKTFGQSAISQEIRLYKGKRRVEFHTVVHWHEKNTMLKVDFPVQVHANESMQEIQFGYVRRPNHHSRPHDADRFEVNQHKWSALAEPGRGFALLNDCKYGISVLDNTMSLTLLRSPTYPDETSDQGVHEFTYGFVFWNGSFYDSPVVREAYELNYPVAVRPCGNDCGQYSLFGMDRPNIIVETVKLSEDQAGDIIVRMYESKGTLTNAVLSTALPVQEAYGTTMLEQNEEPCHPVDGKLALRFRPFEIKTMRLVLKS